MDRPAPVKISEEAFDRARPEDEQVSALLERAYRLRAEGDAAGAIALCEEALSLKADSTSAHSLLGQLYAQEGERDRAVLAYERVLQLNPGSIADRVKLDELRSETETGDRVSGQRPRIVFTEQKFTPENARNGLAMAGLAVALMVAGGALALKLRPQPDGSSPSSSGMQHAAAGKFGPQGNPGQTNTETIHPGAVGQTGNVAQATPSQAGSGAAFNSPFGMGWPGGSQGTSSNVAQSRQSDPPAQITPANLSPSRPGPALPPLNVKNPPKSGSPSGGNGNRVVLSNDDGVTDDGSGNYVIKVDARNSGANSGGNGSKPENGIGGGTIRVGPGPEDNNAKPNPNIGDPPRSEASSAIAMGNDLKAKGDYNRAIQAYKRALPGAGDELAKVHELIARCFQEKGDRASAIDNYQTAISEWQKLISANRQVELARSSIRVCENGIKICRSE
jgi:tetratricopeptide (TPR) repeat protein